MIPFSQPFLIRERGTAMGKAIELKAGLTADDFRAAAKASRDVNQVRRLLALAAICDGRTRDEAAKVGGMDRQTLRDWVHAYNERGIDGLVNQPLPGRPPKFTDAQQAELKNLVEAGPNVETDGIVRWRRCDLADRMARQVGVTVDPDTMGRYLRKLGFSHISARPKHPAQKADAIELFKKRSLTR
jgi:transposase